MAKAGYKVKMKDGTQLGPLDDAMLRSWYEQGMINERSPIKGPGVLTDPASIARYLAAVGEATEVPRRSDNRGPPYWKSRVLRRQVLGDEDECHSRGVDEAP